MKGVRLFNFTLRGDRLGPDSAMVDHFSLDATDIGDPYPKIQFHVAKDEVYKFNVILRSSDYFVSRIQTPFTDNHRFDVERRFGDINLTLFLPKPAGPSLLPAPGTRGDGRRAALHREQRVCPAEHARRNHQ